MDGAAMNPEQWGWIMICAAYVGTAALLLARWMQQEAPKPLPWLTSQAAAAVLFSDLDIESSIAVQALGRGDSRRQKVSMKS